MFDCLNDGYVSTFEKDESMLNGYPPDRDAGIEFKPNLKYLGEMTNGFSIFVWGTTRVESLGSF